MKSMLKTRGLKAYLSQDGAQGRPRSCLSRPYNRSDDASSIQLFHCLGRFRYLRHIVYLSGLPLVCPSPLPVGKGNYRGLLYSLKIKHTHTKKSIHVQRLKSESHKSSMIHKSSPRSAQWPYLEMLCVKTLTRRSAMKPQDLQR